MDFPLGLTIAPLNRRYVAHEMTSPVGPGRILDATWPLKRPMITFSFPA